MMCSFDVAIALHVVLRFGPVQLFNIASFDFFHAYMMILKRNASGKERLRIVPMAPCAIQ